MVKDIVLMTGGEAKRYAGNGALAVFSMWISSAQAAADEIGKSWYLEFLAAAGLTVGTVAAIVAALTQTFRLYKEVKAHIREERERDGKA